MQMIISLIVFQLLNNPYFVGLGTATIFYAAIAAGLFGIGYFIFAPDSIDVEYPIDWVKMHKRFGLIEIPSEASVTAFKKWSGFGDTYEITFVLPETKDPEDWMIQIAKESHDDQQYPSEVPNYCEYLENGNLKIAGTLNGGTLRYSPEIGYTYYWSND
jgi:hypothetical protein